MPFAGVYVLLASQEWPGYGGAQSMMWGEEAGAVETDQPTKPCAVCGGECADQWRLRDEAGLYYHRPCYENGGGPPTKPCAVCGWDCAGYSRLRDERGRYFHQSCYDNAKLRKLAKREASEARRREAADAREREVAEAREREAADARERETADAEKREATEARESAAAEAREREVIEAAEREAAEREAAEARECEAVETETIVAVARVDEVPKSLDEAVIGGAEYAKPVVLVVAGVSALVMTLRAGTHAFEVMRDVTNVVDSLTVLTVCAVLGAVVIPMAATASRGGAAPRTLILLRVAGIYAVVTAVALISVVTVPGDLARLGLIVASVCAYGLTGWLFRLDFAKVVGLVLLAIGICEGSTPRSAKRQSSALIPGSMRAR